jgi:hypothetical protein
MAKQDDKLFTVAGTARNPDGTVKARFANDLVARIKILNKAGCTDITLQELPEPMTKVAALEYLQAQGAEGDASFAVAQRLADKTASTKKASREVVLKTGGKKKLLDSQLHKTKIAKTRGERAVQIGLADSVEHVESVIGKEAAAERI